MKRYTKAPLPFVGQKRQFLKHFEKVINENIPDDGEGWTIVDVFGGSGLLAHTAKQLKPKAKVIYNDFDGYQERLAKIDDTNRLLALLQPILSDIPKQTRITGELKEKVFSVVKEFDGFLDIKTIQTWLCFSGKFVNTLDEIIKQTMYNCVPKSTYSKDGYLDEVVIIKQSFLDLLPDYIQDKKTLLVLDPPYLSTDHKNYQNETYFGMVDFLTMIDFLRPPYIAFSSTRSEIMNYLDYLKNKPEWERVGNFNSLSVNGGINYSYRYQDHMIYKF